MPRCVVFYVVIVLCQHVYRQDKSLRGLLVVVGDGPSHMHVHHISMNWRQINHIHSTRKPCKTVLDRHLMS